MKVFRFSGFRKVKAVKDNEPVCSQHILNILANFRLNVLMKKGS